MASIDTLLAYHTLPLAVVWHTVFFWLFAALTAGFALAVLLEKNVVRMALYLIAALTATAGLFFWPGAQFIGAMQIMSYVGGTLVLLVFGVMLTAQSAFVSLRTPSGEWVLGAIIGEYSSQFSAQLLSQYRLGARSPCRDGDLCR